jgi:hypothetical protein
LFQRNHLKYGQLKLNHIANYLILLQTLYNANPELSGFIALLNQQNKMVDLSFE